MICAGLCAFLSYFSFLLIFFSYFSLLSDMCRALRLFVLLSFLTHFFFPCCQICAGLCAFFSYFSFGMLANPSGRGGLVLGVCLGVAEMYVVVSCQVQGLGFRVEGLGFRVEG